MTEMYLLEELLKTDRPARVSELIEEYISNNRNEVSWKSVGDRANNSGTIQAAGDPARALIERITNGIDAVLERAFTEHSGRPTCENPRQAATAWFGIPAQGLHKMSAPDRRQLAQGAVSVILMPGDGKSKRTVQIADKGLGIGPDKMTTTILSLNAENKIDKFYLIGAFGQGGSATFASSDFTLIASRNINNPSALGFTVVKLSPPYNLKLGTYVYLAKASQVLTAIGDVNGFGEFSTIVRHYGYDLDDYPSPLGPNSLYGRAQSILFDPILPFWFENQVHSYSRTIKGSRSALNGAKDEDDDESGLSHSCPLFFSDLGEFGQIGIEYWVLDPSTKTAPNKAFVSGTRPIVLTVNGQTHAEWSSVIIRKDAGLTHLASRMIVHVDCNNLSFDAKRVLFVSNREESRRGVVQNLIREELLKAFQSDDRLTTLEEEARSAGAKERDESAEKEIKKEVAQMLRLFGFSVLEDAGPKKSAPKDADTDSPHGGKKPRGTPEPINLIDPPTFVEIVAGEAIEFYPGQRRYLRLRTNAHSRYHDARDPSKSRFSFIVDGAELMVAGTSELRDGHMRVILATKDSASIGATGKFLVELRPTNSPTVSTEVVYTIVEKPPAKKGGARLNLPNIDCQPVDAVDSEEWVNLGWPAEISQIASDYVYIQASDTLQVRYSTLFPRYKQALQELRAKDSVFGDSFLKRFEIWLVTNALIHWQDTHDDATSVTNSELEQEEIDDYRRDEMRRMAKASVIYSRREVLFGKIDSSQEDDAD